MAPAHECASRMMPAAGVQRAPDDGSIEPGGFGRLARREQIDLTPFGAQGLTDGPSDPLGAASFGTPRHEDAHQSLLRSIRYIPSIPDIPDTPYIGNSRTNARIAAGSRGPGWPPEIRQC